MCWKKLALRLVVVVGPLSMVAGVRAQTAPEPEPVPPASEAAPTSEPAASGADSTDPSSAGDAPADVAPTPPDATPDAPPEVDADAQAPEPAPPSAPSIVGVPGLMDPAVESAELDLRLAALDAYLADMQPRSRSYFGAWISMMSILAGGQAAQAAFEDDKAERAGLITGASFSTLGLTLVLIAPTPGRYGHKRFSQMPQGTLEEKRRKANQGEEYLRGEAAAVRRTHSLFTHLLGATLGVGGFLGLYLGYDDNLVGALRTGIGTIAVTELRVWTRPKRAIRYLNEYRAQPTVMPTAESLAFAPLMIRGAQGISMAGRF